MSCLLLLGCSTYRAQPLSTDAVDAALRAPELGAVRIAASQLHHPLLAPLVIDGRDGFTPDEVAVMTVITSPKLRALRAQRGVAEAQVIQAGLLPNPQLGYTLDKLAAGNTDPSLINGGSLGVSWEITSLLGYRDRLAAAKSTSQALNLDIAWQEWQAAQAARLSAYRAISLRARLPLARETEGELAKALKETRQAYDRRDKTITDLAAVTEAWSAAQNARFALEQELLTEELALHLALSQPPQMTLNLRDSVTLPELPAAALDEARLAEGLEQRRLDLVALTLGYQSSEASLRAAVKAQFPKIGLSFAKAHDTSDVKTHAYGVTIDLPLFDRNQGQIAVGKATRQQLFDEYVARIAEARADIVRILASLAILRTQLATIEQGLPDLEKIAAALDQAMLTRNAETQAWRDAHGALLARRSEQAKLRQDILDLGVALELATGRPLLTTAITSSSSL